MFYSSILFAHALMVCNIYGSSNVHGTSTPTFLDHLFNHCLFSLLEQHIKVNRKIIIARINNVDVIRDGIPTKKPVIANRGIPIFALGELIPPSLLLMADVQFGFEMATTLSLTVNAPRHNITTVKHIMNTTAITAWDSELFLQQHIIIPDIKQASIEQAIETIISAITKFLSVLPHAL